jgi:phosphodiesterase/alkaline phosphatase D-like protein
MQPMTLSRRAFLRLGAAVGAPLLLPRVVREWRERRHPGSETDALGPGAADGELADIVAWSGDATQNTVEISAWTAGRTSVGVAVSLAPDMSGAEFLPSMPPNQQGWNKWSVTGLSPGTQYYHQFTDTPVGGDRHFIGDVSRFKTLRPAGVPCTITLAVGSCARTAPTIPAAFNDIVDWQPDRTVHLGDLGYPKRLTRNPATHMDNWSLNSRDAGIHRVQAMACMDYLTSDHDTNGTGDGKIGNLPTYHDPVTRANLAAWRQVAPARMEDTHQFPRGRWRSDVEGNVRFVKLDTRCLDKTDTTRRGTDPRSPDSTMLGAPQLAWLKVQIDEAVEAEQLLVLFSDCAWNGTSPGPPIPSTYTDKWPSYIYERDLISDYAAAKGLSMLIVFGDSHVMQQDDGRHEKNGFATLCCGPFDQRPHTHYADSYQWTYPSGSEGGGPRRRVQQYQRITIAQQVGSRHITVTAQARDCSPAVEGTPKTVRTMTKTYDLSRKVSPGAEPVV